MTTNGNSNRAVLKLLLGSLLAGCAYETLQPPGPPAESISAAPSRPAESAIESAPESTTEAPSMPTRLVLRPESGTATLTDPGQALS